MSKYRGPFIGFLYGYGEKASDSTYISSEDLKIVRTSDSDRYTISGFPESEERTVQVPGRDETYYFGRDFISKEINLGFAFDELGEEEFQRLNRVFANKQPQKIIFDETPYKYYLVVPSGAIEINYLCFDTPDGDRVYRGEGSMSFIAYYPYAKSIGKDIDSLLSFYDKTKEEENSIPPLFDNDDILWYNDSVWKTQLPMDWELSIKSGTEIKEITVGGNVIKFTDNCNFTDVAILNSKTNSLTIGNEIKNNYLSTPVLKKITTTEVVGLEPENYVLDYNLIYY